jgi:hypothetical protein
MRSGIFATVRIGAISFLLASSLRTPAMESCPRYHGSPPMAPSSEHPQASATCDGIASTVTMVNAIMNGPDWDSTVYSLPGTISAASMITFRLPKWICGVMDHGSLC